MSDEVPALIGKYKVQSKIAQGGMGCVYKAVHPSLKRDVVIKKMTMRSSAMAKERFKKEAQILLEMQSPYIVHLFDYFTEGPYRYMVEEYVDGLSLDKLIKKQTIIDPTVAMLILQDSCYALKFSHAKKVVHRDIKPGNVLISRRAEIKLADFGIASDENDTDSEKTQANVTLGTPAYMPPEQFENSSAVDNRADIYALGIMLYEMVTGSKPYSSELTQGNISKIRKGRYINPRKLDKTIPPVIAKLIKKMIKPKAKHRFRTVDPIIKIVKKYLKSYDVHAIRVELAKMVINPKPHTVTPFVRKKNIWKSVLVGLVTCGLLYAAGLYLWNEGFIHRTVLRKIYTPVVLSMKIPEVASPASEISAQSIFFSFGENGDKIEEIEGSSRIFFEGEVYKNGISSTRPGSKNKSYVTKPMFLKHGEYRVKVVMGSNVWWKSFTVGDDELVLRVDYFAQNARPLSVMVRAFDAENGSDISGSTNFYVLYKNNWVSLASVPQEKLVSSSVWKFKAESEGYKSEIFSLLIDWYQDTVYCNFSLERK